MYSIDHQDTVSKLKGVPQSSVGAPFPFVMSDEKLAFLSYYVENLPNSWDPTIISEAILEGEPVALIRFRQCYAHIFGPPSEQTESCHPLAQRGLAPYGAYVVENSSWLRWLEQLNLGSVAPYVKNSLLANLKHFIFTFQDSTFECLAEGFDISIHQGPIRSVVPHILKLLEYKPST